MNETITWIKQNRVRSSILAVVLVLFVWFTPFFKATDPANPLFVESLFRLRDYTWNVEKLEEKVFPKLFPVGTSKEYVDLMLVKRGGAREVDLTKEVKGRYDYAFTPINRLLSPSPWRTRVYYDENNRVIAVMFGIKTVVGDRANVPGIPPIKK